MANNFGDRVKAGQANATVLNTSQAKAALDASEGALIIECATPRPGGYGCHSWKCEYFAWYFVLQSGPKHA